jgi:hypothetical protein
MTLFQGDSRYEWLIRSLKSCDCGTNFPCAERGSRGWWQLETPQGALTGKTVAGDRVASLIYVLLTIQQSSLCVRESVRVDANK